MKSKSIWVNCLVQNEDKFIWFAIMSVVNYVDKVLVWDTGSTDKTLEIIKLIKEEYRNKIAVKECGKSDGQRLTRLRQDQLAQSKCDFVMILDGDEIWPEDSIESVISVINKEGDTTHGIVVPFYNLVGDIYHYQDEKAGNYNLMGRKGHLTIRFVNRKTKGLQIKNTYPDEGFYINDMRLQDSQKLKFVDAPYLHATHLVRSSTGKPDKRYRYKYELGNKFLKEFTYPSAFFLDHPKIVGSPLGHRNIQYEIMALLQSPYKFIRRRYKE